MNHFYLHDGRHKHGPYLGKELQQFNITKETSVFIVEANRWINAGEVHELNSLFQRPNTDTGNKLKRIQFLLHRLTRKYAPLQLTAKNRG